MTFSNLPDIFIDLRLIAGTITMTFCLVAILRLIAQYRQRHFSQSVYSIILLSGMMGDALLRTVALTIFPTTAAVITPSAICFLVSQWLEALGSMAFALYLIGIVNGFWEKGAH